MLRVFWYGVLIMCSLMLLALAASYLAVEPGTSTYAIIHLSALNLVIVMLTIGAFLYFDWDPTAPFKG